MRALPGDEFSFVTVTSQIDDTACPVGLAASPRKLDRSNDGQDHTVLPYAISAVRTTRLASAHGVRLNPLPRPALDIRADAARVHRNPAHGRDDDRPPLSLGW